MKVELTGPRISIILTYFDVGERHKRGPAFLHLQLPTRDMRNTRVQSNPSTNHSQIGNMSTASADKTTHGQEAEVRRTASLNRTCEVSLYLAFYLSLSLCFATALQL